MPKESIIVYEIDWTLVTVKAIFLNGVHYIDTKKFVFIKSCPIGINMIMLLRIFLGYILVE